MRIPLFILSILFGINCFGQDLTCEDFKEGTYMAEVLEPVKLQWKIIRKDNEQTEVIGDLPEEFKQMGYPMDPQYIKLQWIDDCSYIGKYDVTKAELTDTQKIINNSGGVLVEMIKIEGNCFYYKSTMKIGEEVMVVEGKMCKEQ